MATRTIGTKLVISGEAEYKKALRESADELKKVQSELKLLSEQYKGSANTAEALRQKVEKLTEAKSAQESVIQRLKDGLKNAREQQDLYARKTKEMEEKIEEANLRLKEMENTAEDTEEQQKELTEAIQEYTQELERCKNVHQTAGESTETWQHKLTTAETALNKLNADILKQTGYLKEAEQSTDGCAKSIDEYGKKVRQVSTDSGELGETVKKSTAAIDALAVTVLSSGVKGTLKDIANTLMECSEAAAGFESALKKVETIADTSAEPMESIKNEIVELSSDLGVAVGDISEATYSAISAGVNTAESVSFVGTATKLAVGGFTDTTVAVDILTTALNAYKMETEEVEQVSDYLITTQNLGKTTVSELASSMGKVIPVASAYNVEMDNLSTAYAVLTANGIATAESTTYLKSMLNELGDSGSTVSKTLKTRTGKTFAELMGQGKSLGDVMEILGDAVENDAGAFNELWSSSEAGIGALSLLGSGSEKYNSVLKQMQESAGATEKAFGLMADTTEMARQRMSVAIDNVKIAVGDSLNPALEELYEVGGDAFEWAAEFIAEHPEIVKAITAITAGMAAFLLGLTAVHGVMLAVNAVMAMNPATILAVALTALVAAVGALNVATVSAAEEMRAAAKAAAEFNDHVEELSESTKESARNYEDQRKEISKNVDSYRKMAAQLEDLTEQSEKTAADREAILSLVEQLNEAVPELALAYDQEAESLNTTAEAIEAVIEAQEELSEYELALERQAELMDENREMTEALEEAETKLLEAQAALEDEGQKSYARLGEQAEAYSNAKAAVTEYEESVQLAEEALRSNEEAMSSVNTEINAYVAANADVEPQTRVAIDVMLEQAKALKDDEAAYQNYIAQVAEAAQAHADYAQEVRDYTASIQGEMQALQEAYNESYESAFENIEKQIGLFDEMSYDTEQSIGELIENLKSQTDYMNTYAENIQKAMELGVDKGIIEKLSDGSEESAKYLAAIVSSGEEEITALNEEFERVQEGKDTFSSAIAELETDFSQKMSTMQTHYDEMVQSLDDFDRAYAASVNTCRGIESGVDAKWGSVVNKYRSLANAAMNAYNSALSIHSPSRKFEWSAEMTIEGVEQGVEKKTPDIEKAYQNVAEAAYRSYQKQGEEFAKETEEAQTSAAVAMFVPSPVKVEESVREAEWSRSENRQQDQAEKEEIIYLTNQTVLDGRVIGESTTKHVVKKVTRRQADRAAAMGGKEVVYG